MQPTLAKASAIGSPTRAAGAVGALATAGSPRTLRPSSPFADFAHTRPHERRRLGISLLISAGLYGALASSVVLASTVVRPALREEEPIDVQFAPEPEPPPAPPAPEAHPIAAVAARSQRPRVAREALRAPDAVPEARPAESDAALAAAPASGADQSGYLDGAPEGAAREPQTVEPASVAPPATPKPKPRPADEAVRLPELALPPVALATNRPPAYPEDARKAGVQGLVIARIVIAADGSVTEVDILRGPEAFRAAVLAALATWRYEPARLPDGTPLAVYRIVQLPFRLENL